MQGHQVAPAVHHPDLQTRRPPILRSGTSRHTGQERRPAQAHTEVPGILILRAGNCPGEVGRRRVRREHFCCDHCSIVVKCEVARRQRPPRANLTRESCWKSSQRSIDMRCCDGRGDGGTHLTWPDEAHAPTAPKLRGVDAQCESFETNVQDTRQGSECC